MNTTTFGLSSKSIWRVVSVFVFFSAADLYLTWKLIDHTDSGVTESNPIAANVLESYGWAGLAVYKFTLVALFFVIAMIIERRRPLGGLFLLLFACGVQASIVASSAFMLYEVETRPVEPDMVVVAVPDARAASLPAGAVTLLAQKSVQAELQITVEQRWAITQLIKQRREMSRDMMNGSLDGWHNRMSYVVMSEDTLMQSLSNSQRKRLQQLTWQQRGPLALGDQEIIDTLRLSPQQVNEVIEIIETTQPHERLPRKKIAAVEVQAKANLWCVLSSNQKEQWHVLIGTPFPFEATAAAKRLQAWDAVHAAE